MARWLCIPLVFVAACAGDTWTGPPALRLGNIADTARGRPVYRTLDGTMRPLLGRQTGPLPPTATIHSTVELEARGRSLIEFGYGVPIREQAPTVTFRITATVDGEADTVFEATLDPVVDAGRWHEFSVELPLERPTTLQFLTMPGESFSSPSEAWFSEPVLQPFDPARAVNRSNLPHVILVSLDTLRADHLSVYGYERNTSC